ncbi:MAG TPA: hypothetical protein VHW04_15770, partial [Solirubrobacteraceae bacterium]|nr:hypothetical protein [Solirubrobacteraceae bacterium]
ERWRDAELAEMADVLREQDIFELPAVAIGGRWFAGAAALQRAGAIAAQPHQTAPRQTEPRWNCRPLAPVG